MIDVFPNRFFFRPNKDDEDDDETQYNIAKAGENRPTNLDRHKQSKVELTNRKWFSVVCSALSLIDNDIRHHSGQNVPRESTTF